MKHSQWLLNRYLIHSDGPTSYCRRWNRNYEGGLCCFGEHIQAKVIGIKGGAKFDIPWKEGLWLGRDTEANEIIVATAEGVVKVRTVRRLPPSEQWKRDPILALKALPWKPKTGGDFSADFISLPTSKILSFGKLRAAPGLDPPLLEDKPGDSLQRTENPPGIPELPDELLPPEIPEHDPDLEDYEPSLPGDDGGMADDLIDDAEGAYDSHDPYSRLKNIPEVFEHPEAPRAKRQRIETPQGSKRTEDDDSLNASSSTQPQKHQRLSAVTSVSKKQHRANAIAQLTLTIASVTNWVASLTGVVAATLKDGTEVPVHVNEDEEEKHEEIKLSEPLIWNATREFPVEAQTKCMNKELQSTKDFSVYTEKPIEQCTEEEIEGAIGLKWVKRWKSDEELRMRLVAQGCYQDDSSLDSDSVFASTPSLVTLRLLLIMSIARGWTITLADISTAFLHALPTGPDGRPPCLWKLNKAMYGLKQSPRLWQEHYASVMKSLGFRRCKSDPNLYCHSSRQLYVLAYVDDLLIAGDSDKAEEFIEALNKELLVKVTARLNSGTEASFLGRRLRHNGDSIDLFMPRNYIDELLSVYDMKESNCVIVPLVLPH